MFRLTIKNLGANKVRFALTTFGVILAVSFVVSAFVLGDGLRSTFTDLSEDITSSVDLQVRPVSDFGDPEPLPMDMVAVVAGIDGVESAVPVIEAPWDSVRPIKDDGEGIATDGPPQIAYNWIDVESLSSFSLVEGTAPGLGEFTIDYTSADKHDFVIGNSYELITPAGRTNLVLSGTSSFGDDNATVGAVLMQMNTAEASEIFGVNGINTVDVQVSNGANMNAVQAAVTAAVPDAEVVDNATVLAETTEEFTGEIDMIGNILLGFGGVALFVSIFIIYNTFAIVLGQRIRELALLRTIGASPKQIRRSVLGEAFVVGVIASVGGIGGGILVAKGLEALMGATGADLPDYPLVLANRTLIVAVVIGIGITMLAAVGPARKASTVPAIAALRGEAESKAVGSRTRKVSGFGLFALGIVSGIIGLSGAGSTSTTVSAMAFGAIAVFLGVTLLSPLVVNSITSVIGWPMRLVAGVSGGMAQRNAARNPRRTATTAAALMVGLALVSTVLVIGESVKATLSSTISESATADYFVTDQLEEVDFPTQLSSELLSSEIVASAVGISYLDARIDGSVQNVAAGEFDQMSTLINTDLREGGYDPVIENPVVIAADKADELGLGVGDVIVTEFSNGASVNATITGVFQDQALIAEDYLFDTSVFEASGVTYATEWAAFSLIEGADSASVSMLTAELATEFPHADIETTEAFTARIGSMIDGVLVIVNVMVALAVVIALIGIANTLALSVFERTRELGLLRAVGMTSRQLRRMVRFEAALVATFGAVLGVSIGILFGWGVTESLPESLASGITIPVARIITLMVIAGVAGVIAAMLPARRAGRLNVLAAIAH